MQECTSVSGDEAVPLARHRRPIICSYQCYVQLLCVPTLARSHGAPSLQFRSHGSSSLQLSGVLIYHDYLQPPIGRAAVGTGEAPIVREHERTPQACGDMDALVEDENERPGVEIIEALLGKRLKVCSNPGAAWRCKATACAFFPAANCAERDAEAAAGAGGLVDQPCRPCALLCVCLQTACCLLCTRSYCCRP